MCDQSIYSYLSPQQRQEYNDEGYLIVRGLFEASDFDAFEQTFLSLVEKLSGHKFLDLHDPALLKFFNLNFAQRTKDSNVFDISQPT